jgi:SPP1 gp7 family putative phage head morphogenesis protein
VRGPDGGKLIDTFLGDWTRTERTRVVGAIRQGFYEGQTTGEILRAVRGTRANQYKDGILSITNRNASAVVRTAIQHVASEARFATWAANDDILKGYRWLSTLDGRTSTQCRSLDQQVFPVDKGPRPPVHIQCRSTTIAELIDELKLFDDAGTRASMGGQVAGDQSYYDWLKGQPSEFQDDVLGVTRATLFRNGGLSTEQFARLQLGRNFMPLTLAEMKAREPLAFARAFAVPTTAVEKQLSPSAALNSLAFGKAPKALRDMANNFPVAVTNNRGGAYARAGSEINLPDSYDRKSTFTRTVWRHEMGHIIDVNLGKASGSYHRYISGTAAWTDARSRAKVSLQIAAGDRRRGKLSLAESKKYRDGEYESLRSIVDLTAKDRVEELSRMSARIGLDLEKTLDTLKNQSVYLESFQIGAIESAGVGIHYRMARILKAIELGDAEEFLIQVSGKDVPGLSVVTVVDSWSKDSLGMMTDLVGAISRNKYAGYKRGFMGHSDSYYSKSRYSQGTEMFANLTAIHGHEDPNLWEITKRLFPELAQLFEDTINGKTL